MLHRPWMTCTIFPPLRQNVLHPTLIWKKMGILFFFFLYSKSKNGCLFSVSFSNNEMTDTFCLLGKVDGSADRWCRQHSTNKQKLAFIHLDFETSWIVDANLVVGLIVLFETGRFVSRTQISWCNHWRKGIKTTPMRISLRTDVADGYRCTSISGWNGIV